MAREISASTFVFCEKSCFYTDKTGSIEWQDLESRHRICDCYVIHTPRSELCDQIKAPNFSARGRASPLHLLRGARYSGPQTDVAISAFWEVNKNNYASLTFLPLL